MPSPVNIILNQDQLCFSGPAGSLPVSEDDQISRRLAMLLEGLCLSSPAQAARKYGFTRQRFNQIRQAYRNKGAEGLRLQTPGPKSNYRRTDQVQRLVIRWRFLDPDASASVIAQKIRQQERPVSTRSVERVIADFGLQKKTLHP